MVTQRKIIHVDMDAFFASVEQRDNPEYQGKPLIVGGKPNSRGVVAACSYEAREFGIRSAMACSKAYRLCPEAIFVPPRFEAYREVSVIIREIFWRYGSQVEPLSLDEAYIDVTYTAAFDGSATRIAQAIREEIRAETGLVASAGVSYNKFLAKIASDMDKPDGLYVIKPEQGADFVATLPVGKFFGVGPATEKKMQQHEIYKGSDMLAWSLESLTKVFGKSASYYYNVVRGIDNRPVRSSRERKSLGKETTFKEDILDESTLLEYINQLTDKVMVRVLEQDLKPKTMTLKVKYANFKQVTRAYTQTEPFTEVAAVKRVLSDLLQQTEAGKQAVRLVGVTASGFKQENEEKKSIQTLSHAQLSLSLKQAFD
ncbi:MAG: DNA polymerase IV [Ghiorsea sp.]